MSSNETKQSIIILDFSTGNVYIADYDANIVEDYNHYYEILNEEHDLNLSDSNCQCIILDKPFTITHL